MNHSSKVITNESKIIREIERLIVTLLVKIFSIVKYALHTKDSEKTLKTLIILMLKSIAN